MPEIYDCSLAAYFKFRAEHEVFRMTGTENSSEQTGHL